MYLRLYQNYVSVQTHIKHFYLQVFCYVNVAKCDNFKDLQKHKSRKSNIRTKLLTEYNFIVVKYPIWQASGNIKIDGANIISFN